MGKINRDILRLAIPAIIANITTPLLALIDTAIVGHLGDPAYLAAVAIGGSIFSMLYWPFGFLRMGTSGLTAQAHGANNKVECDATLWRALLTSTTIGLLIVILQKPINEIFLHFIETDTSTSHIAKQYIDILIYGAPASLGLYAVNGWLIGKGNSRKTMWISLIINLSNILVSLLLVYGVKLGIAGVATGTLCAQWIGFASGILMIRNYRIEKINLKIIFIKEKIKQFFSINTDIFFRTLCLVAVTVWFTKAGAKQGDIILSVNALLMQLFMLFSYIMDGFAYAGEALVGSAIGAGNNIQEKKTIKHLFLFGASLSFIFTLAYFFLGDNILSLLSDNLDVIQASEEYRWWAVSVPFAGFGAFIWDGIYTGATMTRRMLLSMAIACIIFFAIYFSLLTILGNHALWFAFILYLFSRGIMQTLLYNHSTK